MSTVLGRGKPINDSADANEAHATKDKTKDKNFKHFSWAFVWIWITNLDTALDTLQKGKSLVSLPLRLYKYNEK